MKAQAAVLWSQPGEWDVREVEVDEPGPYEVLVRVMASGLCHSDDHRATGDMPTAHLPTCGGHEGAGIVEAVGRGVSLVAVGDHVVTSFIPMCGRCRWCASGQQNLCDNGAIIGLGTQLDGGFRMWTDGATLGKPGPVAVGQSGMLATFSQWTVTSELSVIKVPDDIPFASACLLGCGVPTGWGSAVTAADVAPGDVVIVMGAGGVGINAVQGARHAGATHIVAVDPVPFKLDVARQLGATTAFAHIAEAADYGRSITNGQGADSTIVTVGIVTGDHIAEAFGSIRKAGTVVVTGMANASEIGIPVNLAELVGYQKRIQGCLYGMRSGTRDIPMMVDLYRSGQLKLDELITQTYNLDEINTGYADLHSGRNIRGVVLHEH